MSLTSSCNNLTWQAADRVVKAAIAKAQNDGLRICAVVVDRGGHLLALGRMEQATFHSVQIATDKAYTAASFKFSTRLWRERLQDRPHLANGLGQQPRFLLIGGGEPLVVDGEVVGAIGVSGASEDQDGDCALAGVAALSVTDPAAN